MSLKTVLAGLGIALLSACSGSPTGPSAPVQAERSTTMNMGTRSDMSGYVVAERDSGGGNGLMGMTQQITRKVPVVGGVVGGVLGGGR